MSAEDALRKGKTQLGQVVGTSPWHTVLQSDIEDFAKTTRDTQWIHVDTERAKAEGPFGSTIAHGFLTLSLASHFSVVALPEDPGLVMGLNYGFDRLRFLHPVRPGDRVRGRFELIDIAERKPGEIMRKHKLTIEISGLETPALVADWLTLAIFHTP